MKTNRGDIHPDRYPQHSDCSKGQVFAGECNRSVCQAPNARSWNRITFGFYCTLCAADINRNPAGILLCIDVDRKPSIDEMNRLRLDATAAPALKETGT